MYTVIAVHVGLLKRRASEACVVERFWRGLGRQHNTAWLTQLCTYYEPISTVFYLLLLWSQEALWRA